MKVLLPAEACEGTLGLLMRTASCRHSEQMAMYHRSLVAATPVNLLKHRIGRAASSPVVDTPHSTDPGYDHEDSFLVSGGLAVQALLAAALR